LLRGTEVYQGRKIRQTDAVGGKDPQRLVLTNKKGQFSVTSAKDP